MQQLIWEEVIQRRDQNIQAFKRGLSQLKLFELIQKHPDLLKPLFVAQPSQREITAEDFWGLVASLKPHEHQRARVFEYFREFVFYLGGKLVCVWVSVIYYSHIQVYACYCHPRNVSK